MSVTCQCRVLPGLSDELITRPESPAKRCVCECDQQTSRMRRPWLTLGRSATKKKVP